MNSITRAAKKSPRLFAIALSIALVSTIGLASQWDSLTNVMSVFGASFQAAPTASDNAETQPVSVTSPFALIPQDTRTVCSTGTPDFPTVAAAVADANTAVPAGGRTYLVCAGLTETAPAGGYSITATGASAANPVVFVKDGAGANPTITAPTPQTSGALTDAIFKIIGADYITIDGFTMLENPANTTTAAGTNNMTEFGVALFYATTTNGAQNITIQNNTITLNRTYQNTWGIYSNSTHSATVITTSASATTTAGGNSGLKVYGNTISNVNQGILVLGPTAAADMNTGIDIGGAGGVQANSITNWGTTGTFSGYVNVSGTLNCILIRNSVGFNVSFNTLTSSVGGNTATTSQRAIFVPAFSIAPTGTFTNNINNNNISIQSGFATGTLNGIINEGTTGTATSSLVINNNNFNTFGHTVAASGATTFINSTMAHLNTTINNNTFTNLTLPSTGSATFISNSVTVPAGGSQTINGNSIVTAFNKTGAGGTVTGITSGGSSTTVTSNWNNNNFSNMTVTGATAITFINNTDGGTVNHNIIGNTFSNITGGTSAIIGINSSFGGGNGGSGNLVSGNTVSNINSAGAISGIVIGTSGTTSTVISNIVNTLASSGASLVVGITSGAPTSNSISKNKVYDLSGSNASSTVSGIAVTGGTLHTVFNNLIGNLTTPAANAANPLNGLNITGGTTVNAYFNTVYLNGASTGALFGSSAVNVSTAPTVDLRNNIFVNTSTAVGATGFTSAYRRSTTTLTSYSNNSNNNLFYAGTPSATNLIFYDGTNSDLTLANFKARVTPRDAASVTENPPFLSTTGSSAQFLHISTVTPTFIESGGSTVSGITDDFDGDTRTATPDIGADEFAGTSAGDFSPPSITYTALTNTASTADRTLATTITDATGIGSGVGAPLIYYRKGTSGAFTSAVATTISGSTYTFTISASALGGVTANDMIQYYVAAQDTASTPNVATNPAGGSGINPPGSTAPASFSSYIILPIINTFPYSQDFEANNGGWTAGVTTGAATDWTFGTPAKTQITGAHSGVNAWVTKLTLTYTTSTTSTLTSPVIDFSTLSGRPTFSFWSNFKTEAAWDAGILEYSINGGTTWIKVDANLGTGGTFNTTDSTGWYNNSSSSGPIAPPKFSGTSTAYTGHAGGWIQSATLLPAAVVGQSDVRLRYTFGSDGSTNDEGWAIDDVSITPPSPGILQFSSVSYSGTENTSATITVTRTGGSAGAVSVGYATSNGTATAGTCGTDDYVAASGTLNWADGVTTAQTFNVTLCADAVVDPAETVNLTLGSVTGGAVIGANNPAVLTITDVPPPLATGTYTVGSGGSFGTLTSAIAYLNSSGISGPVTLSLIDSTYPSETFPLTINAVPGASSTNTITIKPAVGISPTISGSSTSCLVNLNGADYVTIDGSNAVSGTTKDLTISNTSTSGATVCFVNEATNNNLKNSLVKGVSTLASNGVVFFSTVSSGTAGNSTNTVQNNDISGGATAAAYTFFNLGTSTAKNTNNIITQNRFFNFSNTGIRDDGNSVNTTYSLNEIFEATTQTTSLTGFRPSATSIDGFIFTRNFIHDLNTTGTGFVYGIHLFDTSTVATSEVSNNMITLSPTAPLTVRGIYDQTATGEKYNVYFNSVYIGGTVTGASNSEAYYWSIASTTNARNNIFVNARTGGTGKHYAYRTTTTLANLISDYNDIFNTGGTANVFGNNGTADVPDLATWQMAPTVGTGKDLNSKSVDPLFVSTADLHLQASSTLESMGTSIAAVTVDFDGDTRPATPDIGADEIAAAPAGTVQFSSATYSVTEGTPTVTLTVTRTGGSSGAVTVNYSLSGGTATGTAGCGTAGEDYVNTGGSVMFANGDTADKTFDVTICNDAVYELNQTFNATLAIGSGGATLGTPNPATVTINNDDAVPTVSIADVTQAEGNSGTSNFGFAVTITGQHETGLDFSYATANGTATAGSDYVADSGGITVPPFATGTNAFNVVVNGDTNFEPNETFFFNLSACNNCTFSDNQGLGTIQNDDTQPSFAFSSPTYSNNDDLTGDAVKGDEIVPELATITVIRSGATGDAVSVNYATTAGGTATSGANCTTGVDYISTSSTLSFAAGETMKTFDVTVCSDNLFEGDETVNLTLSSPTLPAILGMQSTAVLTLVDNETIPTLAFDSATYSNSDDIARFGVTTDELTPSVATITVVRTGATGNAVSVQFATMGGTATGGANCTTGVDYITTSGTLNFSAGDNSETFNVTVCTDALFEGNETVNLALSNPLPSMQATLGMPNAAVLTIVDNDAQPSLQFSSPTYGVGEAGPTATITVTRTGAADNAVSVNYGSVAGGTAIGGAACGGAVDYENASGTLTFAGGEMSKTFTVAICDDAASESSETVNLELTSPTGAVLGMQNTAVLTITDNDAAPTLQFSASSVSVSEAAAAVTLTVTRAGASGNAVTVDYATGGGTATAGVCAPGVDYVAASGTLNFAAGETSKPVNITICNDAVYELNQTFNVTLSNATGGATVGTPATETVTITNDDAAPSLVINDITAPEGNSGTTNFQLTTTVTGANEVPGQYEFQTANNTATAPSDYTAIPSVTINIPANVNRTTLTLVNLNILVNGDTAVEADETFFLNGSSCMDCTFTDNQGVATIQNDDTSLQFAQPSYTVSEGVGTVTLTVTRAGTSAGAISVNYVFTGLTANGAASCGAGIDFAAVSGTLNWASGDSASKTFNVAICEDALVEGTESFVAALQSPTGGATIGTQSSTQVDITDNDSDTIAPTISYTPLSNTGSTTNPVLSVTATDNVGVTAVTIFWSVNGGAYTSAACASAGMDAYNCTIGGTLVNPSAISYYVTAQDAAMNAAANPSAGAMSPNLFTIGGATIPSGTYANISLGQGATLGGNFNVLSSLELNGIVNTDENTLTLECGATVTGGGAASYVVGNLEKRFCALGMFTFPVGASVLTAVPGRESLTPEGIASNYSPMTAQITALTPNSSLTVSVTDNFMPGSEPTNSLSRYWSVTENGDLTANLIFNYRNEDVVGVESTYNVLRRAGFTANYAGGTIDTVNNTATAPNVSNFSIWGAGQAIPTAANAELSGRLLTASGEGIRNATVMLSGGTLTEPVYVQTGSFGGYRFENLPVGQTYIVTVISKRYTFANPTRIINLTDTATDENFVADDQ